MPNVRIVTLGCAKNDVDSEEIAGVLSKAGYEVDGSEDAEVTIINTCGFLEAAKEESLAEIHAAILAKQQGKTKRVIVAGCLAQRMGGELRELAPGADAYIGVGQMARFGEIVGKPQERGRVEHAEPQHLWADVQTRARTGAPWSAYLKISEGCDHRCTFCTIPSFRGKHQSKSLERVLLEANHLAKTGAREINLIAQDVTQYGYDLYKQFTMPRLLNELSEVEGIDWVRLLYCYPNRLTSEVIDAMATSKKVCNYIDVPLQHAHPDVLRMMKRPWSGERYLKLFEDLRNAMPDCAIRTTFIVGFPGETKEHFDYLLQFIKEAQLDRVGAFTFSREPGTPSHDMPNQVQDKEKQWRYNRLMKGQQGISLAKNREWIGRKLNVLLEGYTEDGWMAGRSHRDAPEIDGLVYVEQSEGLRPGDMVETTVIDAAEYDLFATTGAQAQRRIPLRQAAPVQPR
ncbi:MAG: 30S ribosomal protein S12 methylthiotransferase RimO [Fimbriimonadales bacterium]